MIRAGCGVATSFEKELPPGTVLRGKWNGNRYVLERLLGVGSNGKVYLASRGKISCALKLGSEAAELQGEANVLLSLDRREKRRSPFLLDVDDAAVNGRDVPFYVMQYVAGVPVKSYLQQRGTHWFGVIGYRLLERLAEIHEAGWVFGDIKNDNILVADYGRVALVDYGGMTAVGRSVRQFTEIYDRGYWSAGSRTADPAYDWFAVAVLWLYALDGKRLLHLTRTLLPQNRNPGELMELVRTNPHLKPMEDWMSRALTGRFQDSREATLRWRESFGAAARRRPEPGRGMPGWMAGLFAASLALCAAAAAAAWLRYG